jgi:hypothetical protein
VRTPRRFSSAAMALMADHFLWGLFAMGAAFVTLAGDDK